MVSGLFYIKLLIYSGLTVTFIGGEIWKGQLELSSRRDGDHGQDAVPQQVARTHQLQLLQGGNRARFEKSQSLTVILGPGRK